MALIDSQKVSNLYKKIIGGVTDTSISSKDAANETISSQIIVLNTNVWGDSTLIPVPATSVSTSIVAKYSAGTAIQCKNDSTVPGNRTWFAMASTANPITNTFVLKNWVPPSIDPTYLIKVYAGDPNSGGVLQNQLTTGSEIIVDYSAGCIHFPNTVPAAVSTSGVWVEGFRYTGTLGPISLSPSGVLDINGITVTAQALVVGTGGTNFNIVSATGGGHTFNLPDASTANRGVVTTGSQTFAGNKNFTGNLIANTVVATNGLTAGYTIISSAIEVTASTYRIFTFDATGLQCGGSILLTNGLASGAGNPITIEASPFTGSAAYTITLPRTGPGDQEILVYDGGLGGFKFAAVPNLFDQSLNTTDEVTFFKVLTDAIESNTSPGVGTLGTSPFDTDDTWYIYSKGMEIIANGNLKFYDNIYTSYVAIAADNGITGSYTVYLPIGQAAGALTNDGFGNLSWAGLTDAHIFVGNASNVATDVVMSGDTTIDNTGAVTIGDNKVTLPKLYNGAQLAIINSFR